MLAGIALAALLHGQPTSPSSSLAPAQAEELRTARRALLAYAGSARDFRLTGLARGRCAGSPSRIAQAKDLADRADALFCAVRDIVLAAQVNGCGGQ